MSEPDGPVTLAEAVAKKAEEFKDLIGKSISETIKTAGAIKLKRIEIPSGRPPAPSPRPLREQGR